MKTTIQLTTKEEKAIIDFLEGNTSQSEMSRCLGIKRQNGYVAFTRIIKNWYQKGKLSFQ